MQDSRAGIVEEQDRRQQLRVCGFLDSQQVPAKHRLQAIARGEFPGDLAVPVQKRIVKSKRKWHRSLLLAQLNATVYK